jgi:Uncharacterised methyltransferase family (DUF6094)
LNINWREEDIALIQTPKVNPKVPAGLSANRKLGRIRAVPISVSAKSLVHESGLRSPTRVENSPAAAFGSFLPLEVHVRNVARIKLGYYPLPLAEGKRLRKLLVFSSGTASVVDPCVGTGNALHQLTDGAQLEKQGIELDANRASAAAVSGIRTIQGDLFNTIAKVDSCCSRSPLRALL